MTNAHSLPDYKERYFEYKELIKIHGKPTLDKIIKVWRQLKRNAQRIPTTLGGGNHGYLALLITATDYLNIPGTTAFNRPGQPGIFHPVGSRGAAVGGARTRSGRGMVAPRGGGVGPLIAPTPAEIAIQKAVYDENLRQYNEVQCVETLLRNQLLNSFESQYVDALRDSNDMINLPIHSIMTYLTRTYGQISEEHYMSMEDEIKELVYEPTLPVDIVFNKIDFFVDISKLTDRDVSARRQVQLAYLIFNRAGVFRDSLKTWNARASNIKTYAELKIFMRDEHSALDMVGALSIKDTSLDHANMLQALSSQQEQLADNFQRNLFEAFETYAQIGQNSLTQDSNHGGSESKHELPSEISNMISNISNSGMKNSGNENNIATLLQNMIEKMNVLETKMHGGQTSKVKSGTKVNPKNGKAWKRYCWTCGCCDHWGKFCPNPTAGHKNDATFKDRMNGSTEGVLGA